MKNFDDLFREIEIKSKLKSKGTSNYWFNYSGAILSKLKEPSNNFDFSHELTIGFGDERKKINESDIKVYKEKYFFLKFLLKLDLIRKILFIYLNYKKHKNYLKLLNKISKNLGEIKNLNKISLNRSFKNSKSFINFKNIKISKTYFKLLILYNLTESKLLINRKKNIIDIGSGYGAFIDIFNILNPNKNYLYYLIDIFPINFITFIYLKQMYNNNVSFLLNNSVKKRTKFLVVPNFLFEKILTKKNNIFFNFNSFQEMSLTQVKSYINKIKKTSKSYLVIFIYKSLKNNKTSNRIEELLKLNFKIYFEKKYNIVGFLNGKYQIYKIN